MSPMLPSQQGGLEEGLPVDFPVACWWEGCRLELDSNEVTLCVCLL